MSGLVSKARQIAKRLWRQSEKTFRDKLISNST